MFDEIICQFNCDNQILFGICHPATNNTGIVIITGGPQYRIGSHRQFLLIARSLAKAHYPVFRFDYRGMGDSSMFKLNKDISFDQTSLDISKAIKQLKKYQPQIKNIVLMGLCDAASAILISLANHKLNLAHQISGIVLINPWVYQNRTKAKTYLKYYYMQRLQETDFWLKLFKFKVNILHSLKSIINRYKTAFLVEKKSSSDDSEYIDKMLIGLLNFKGKILTILSENDLTAKEFLLFIEENKKWTQKLNQIEHQLVTLANTDHTFSNKKKRSEVIKSILHWL